MENRPFKFSKHVSIKPGFKNSPNDWKTVNKAEKKIINGKCILDWIDRLAATNDLDYRWPHLYHTNQNLMVYKNNPWSFVLSFFLEINNPDQSILFVASKTSFLQHDESMSTIFSDRWIYKMACLFAINILVSNTFSFQ